MIGPPPPIPPRRTSSLAPTSKPKPIPVPFPAPAPKPKKVVEADPESIMMQLFEDVESAMDPFRAPTPRTSPRTSPTPSRPISPAPTVRYDSPPSPSPAPRLSLPSYFLDSPTTPTQASFSADLFASLPMLGVVPDKPRQRGASLPETAPLRVKVRTGTRKVRPKSRAGEGAGEGVGVGLGLMKKDSGEWTMADLSTHCAPLFPLPPTHSPRLQLNTNTNTTPPRPSSQLYINKPLPSPPSHSHTHTYSPTTSLTSSTSSLGSSISSSSSPESDELLTPPATPLSHPALLPITITSALPNSKEAKRERRRGSSNLEALEAFLVKYGGERKGGSNWDWDAEEEVKEWRGRVRGGVRKEAGVTVVLREGSSGAGRRVRFEEDL